MTEADLLDRLGALMPIKGQRLAGKVAVVSGGGSGGEFLGTGGASALLFAAQGASVGVLDVDGDRARATCAFVEQIGGQATPLNADLTSEDECRRAIEELVAQFGGVHVVMNNAAIARRGDVETVTDADWEASFRLNTLGTMYLTRAAAPHLANEGGAVVNVSSIAAHRGVGAISYVASKAAVEGMTRDMAFSLGTKGVRANCVIPGALHTPIAMNAFPDAREAFRRGNALGVEGTAWDVAWAALFLASDEARWITGTTLLVDAGASIINPLAR